MRPQLLENPLTVLLRHCYLTPSCQAVRYSRPSSIIAARRALHAVEPRQKHKKANADLAAQKISEQPKRLDSENSTSADPLSASSTPHVPDVTPRAISPQALEVAVVGGGITGLATSNRLGGWIQSKRVNVEGGSVLLEQGPRTLQPGTSAGLATLGLINDLGLDDELIVIPKSSPSAQNRFVYYPDHLVAMPAPGKNMLAEIWKIFTEPIFQGVVVGALAEHTRRPRPASVEDESIGSFLERRFGTNKVADNMLSAVMHGIYGGDIYQLSAKSLLKQMWEFEGKYGTLSNAFMIQKKARDDRKTHGDPGIVIRKPNGEKAILHLPSFLLDIPPSEFVRRDLTMLSLRPKLRDVLFASVYTFKNGISALTDALKMSLEANPRVTIKLDCATTGIEYDRQNSQIEVKTNESQPNPKFTQVISTIPAKKLAQVVEPRLPSLAEQHSVSIMVVNLFYSNPSLLDIEGFGYLIPRSIPLEQNPERALGVVFDSCSSAGQDTAPGTKLTVMLGGHWWDGFTTLPSEAEGETMAKAVLKRHLGITDEPTLVHVAAHANAIPQYTVGHDKRLRVAHEDLMSHFGGRLTVVGNSYKGVGANDCVLGAWNVVRDLGKGESVTGLEPERK